MSENSQRVQRTVDTVSMMAGKATRFSSKLLLGTTIVCVGGFLLGIAALSGGIQTVWIVLGIVFGSLAVGSSAVARWRVGAVRRHVPELAVDIRRLVSEGVDTTRTVIDTFETDAFGDGSGIELTRKMYGFRGTFGHGLSGSKRLAAATTALTSFPLLALGAIAISLVFGFLGFIFLVALAL